VVGDGNHGTAVLLQNLHELFGFEPGFGQAQYPAPEFIRHIAVMVVAVKVDLQTVFGVKAPGLLTDKTVKLCSKAITELWFAVALPLRFHTQPTFLEYWAWFATGPDSLPARNGNRAESMSARNCRLIALLVSSGLCHHQPPACI